MVCIWLTVMLIRQNLIILFIYFNLCHLSFCCPCCFIRVYFGHECFCAHKYADVSHVHVVHISAQEDIAFVISKVCLYSPPDLPHNFLEKFLRDFLEISQRNQPFSRLTNDSFHNLEAHRDKLWLSVRLPGKKTKGRVLLSCNSVHLNSAKESRIRSLRQQITVQLSIELQSTV